MLKAVCTYLSARTVELETATYPALDELTTKVNIIKLMSVVFLSLVFLLGVGVGDVGFVRGPPPIHCDVLIIICKHIIFNNLK